MRFCINCGDKVKEDDKFCQNCGTAVSKENQTLLHHNDKKDLEQKGWFRFLKVAYILIYIIVIGGILVIGFSSIPQANLNSAASNITCTNGESYNLSKNDIYAYSVPLDSYSDEDARILCAYNTTNYSNSYYFDQTIPLNYTLDPVYTPTDYDDWFWEFAIGLVVGWVFLKLLRMGVLYIIAGTKFNWKEFKKII
jgi:hypothetical protein